MTHLGAKKRKKQQEQILRLRIRQQQKSLTLQQRTVAKWVEYLTCHNGVGVNLVKVDGRKIRLLDPGSVSPFRQKKLKVNYEEIIKYILVKERDLFSSPNEIMSSVFALRRKGVIDLDFSIKSASEIENKKPHVIWDLYKNTENLKVWIKKLEIYAYMITDYY